MLLNRTLIDILIKIRVKIQRHRDVRLMSKSIASSRTLADLFDLTFIDAVGNDTFKCAVANVLSNRIAYFRPLGKRIVMQKL